MRSDVIQQFRVWRNPAMYASIYAYDLLTLYRTHSEYIKSNASSEELYEILEQVITAACECHDLECAIECFKILRNKFPDSHRVDRQLALIFESQGDLKNAVEGYEALVEEDPLDLISRKRQINIILNNICMSSENGTNGGETGNERAISTLVDHLSQFQADHESWMVLANLYCNEWKLSNAAYCLEEVILHMPDNRHIICRYAEIQYSGNPDQQRIRSARQYFIYANRLCPKWIRPLFGILVCCSRLRRTETQSDNISVFAWAKLQLKSLCQPCKLSVCVDKFIKSIEY